MQVFTLLATVAAVAIAILETTAASETAETTRTIADILKKVTGTKCVPWQIPFLGTSLCVRFDTPGNTLGETALNNAMRTVKAMTADDSLTVRRERYPKSRGREGGRRAGRLCCCVACDMCARASGQGCARF